MKWLLFIAILFPAVSLRAQVGRGETGFMIFTQAGNAGTVCSPVFSCTPFQATALRGEQTMLVVRGVKDRPFVVMVGLPQQAMCLTVPGIHNAVVFPPILFPFAGTLTQPDRILACPGGFEQMPLTIPLELPVGASFLMQAVAWSFLIPPGEMPTFTAAIQVGVW
jgi:hypothetical protein